MIFNEHNFVFILRNTERIKKEYIMNKDSSYYLLFIIYYSLHYNNNIIIIIITHHSLFLGILWKLELVNSSVS